MLTRLMLGCCICCVFSRAALAWNFPGHMVVAQLAHNHLDSEVRAKCDALLKVPGLCSSSTNDTFVSAAVWADSRCEAGTSPQHYIDFPISLDGSPTDGVVYNPTNAATAITAHIQMLQNPASDVTNQARSLRYLIHFVGDIQQPMHCSTGVTSKSARGLTQVETLLVLVGKTCTRFGIAAVGFSQTAFR